MLRAFGQLDDPVFLGVLLRSLVLAVLAFGALLAGSAWAVGTWVAPSGGVLGWLAQAAGGVLVALLAVWLFVPVALLIATLYIDRVAAAVDRRFYPGLPVPRGASAAVQVWDGVILGAQVLALQVVALILALFVPGVGLLLAWAITGWAIGRGLFVAVAMRRMPRSEALRAFERERWPVLVQGGLLALAATIPPLNLLVPVLGVAALTHVLNEGRAGPPRLALLRGP